MVTKRKLLKKITALEEKNKELEKITGYLFNAVKSLNKKVTTHIKGDDNKEDTDKINDWLKDDRVDEVQAFLHKGVK